MICSSIFTTSRVKNLLLCRLCCIHDVKLTIKIFCKISGRLHKFGENSVFSLVMELILITEAM